MQSSSCWLCQPDRLSPLCVNGSSNQVEAASGTIVLHSAQLVMKLVRNSNTWVHVPSNAARMIPRRHSLLVLPQEPKPPIVFEPRPRVLLYNPPKLTEPLLEYLHQNLLADGPNHYTTMSQTQEDQYVQFHGDIHTPFAHAFPGPTPLPRHPCDYHGACQCCPGAEAAFHLGHLADAGVIAPAPYEDDNLVYMFRGC